VDVNLSFNVDIDKRKRHGAVSPFNAAL